MSGQALATVPRGLPVKANKFSLTNISTVAQVRYATDIAQLNRCENEKQSQQASSYSEESAITRRLSELSDDSLMSGGKGAKRLVEDAGFSDELKDRLIRKIKDTSFRSQHANAFAEASLAASAPKHVKDIAAATPWVGSESTEEASLRMLNDAYKPIRVSSRSPPIRGPPSKVDTGRPKSRTDTGVRLANARDKTSVYSFMKDSGLTEHEREKLRQEMKQRFAPASRAVPATIQGLASLANERIEDAIARGQFKNLPRGKTVERDHNASSPFIDTTEYLMNKIIQKQDIVPPWIEKQQEVVSTAARFRGRLRADWRRHMSRVIASKGGSLEKQIETAQEYARAEIWTNPIAKTVENVNAMDDTGHLSRINLAGKLKIARNTTTDDVLDHTEHEIRIVEQNFDDEGRLLDPHQSVMIRTSLSEEPSGDSMPTQVSQQALRKPKLPPFRDPQWEETERGYHTAAVDNLNALTRSYNLMAPSLARKPYYSLDRELKACFADVAPQIPAAIRERAYAPKIKGVEVLGHKPGGVMDRLGASDRAVVFDERKPQYGFKEFWRDLFARPAQG